MDQAEYGSLTLLLVFGIGGMLILAIGIISFFVVYQKRILLQQKKLLQLETEQQKILLASIINAQEEERARIASDLHDSVGSLLSATSMYLKRIQAGIQESDLLHIRKESLLLLTETILNIRNITHNLLPQNLERFGLGATLEDLVKRVGEITMLHIDYTYNIDVRFDRNVELAIYRIAQELLNNTVKYAEATKVDIYMEVKDQILKFDYRDNGVGFDMPRMEDVNKTKGLGLVNIRSRVNAINGNMMITTGLGKGVCVNLSVRLQ